ncbi:hypothetical protein ILYODFUR_028638 [Ilyodon furcidens]|uniref:Secreted protein n=1 Tax=Ilyodon furcidens TaxID=33524 RepID=A0ABV0U1D6_9TELE
MCDCDCVFLFLCQVSSLFWISLGPPIKCGASFLPATLPAGGWCLCSCGSRCLQLGALVCAGSLPVAACRGLGPWVLSGLCLGRDVSRGDGSLGPWLDLLWHRRVLAGPVGSSLQLPRASAPGLLGGSPALLWRGCGRPGSGSLEVPVLWGPFDVCGSDLLRVCLRSRRQVCCSSHLLLHIFYGETLYTQACSHSQVFKFRC